LHGIGEGAGDRLEDLRTRRIEIVGWRMEEAVQPGHPEEVGVARGLHVAQLADRLLLRDQGRRLDRGEGLADQSRGGWA
jgi:hypothetical protein